MIKELIPILSCFLFLQAGPPDIAKIPYKDAVGVTVVLLTCSYKTKEFIRVGYYVNNEYNDPELKENPPEKIQFDKVCQLIIKLNTIKNTMLSKCLE